MDMMAADTPMDALMKPGKAYGYSLKNFTFPNVDGNFVAGLSSAPPVLVSCHVRAYAPCLPMKGPTNIPMLPTKAK